MGINMELEGLLKRTAQSSNVEFRAEEDVDCEGKLERLSALHAIPTNSHLRDEGVIGYQRKSERLGSGLAISSNDELRTEEDLCDKGKSESAATVLADKWEMNGCGCESVDYQTDYAGSHGIIVGTEQEDVSVSADETFQSVLTFSPDSQERMRLLSRFGYQRKFEGLPPLDVLDLMREAATLTRRQSDLYSVLSFTLIMPLSIITLTHILISHTLVDKVADFLELIMYQEAFVDFFAAYNKYLYTKLAEFLLTSIFYLPFATTFSVLANAAAVYTVAFSYAGLRMSYSRIVRNVVRKAWVRLIVTYLCWCFIVLGSCLAVILCLSIIKGLSTSLHMSSVTTVGAIFVVGLVFCIFIICIKIVLGVANVVVVLENSYGFAALVRSFSLVQARKQVAVLSFIVSSSVMGFVVYLFESRVRGKGAYANDPLSPAWEGPLLVLMHSFVYLYDLIMTSVFYFTCPTSSRLENFDRKVEEGWGIGALSSQENIDILAYAL